MGNFIWINFWIVLFYVCFPANSSPIRTEHNIHLMTTDVKCDKRSEFYTPITENLRPECITAALECFLTELKTVRVECEDPDDLITYTEEFLESHINATKEAPKSGVLISSDCLCENWPQKPLTEHLNEMENLADRVLEAASKLTQTSKIS